MSSVDTTVTVDAPDHGDARQCEGSDTLNGLPVGRHEVRVVALEQSDTEEVFAMLRRCTNASLYRRFHGVTDGTSHATNALAGADDQDAYGAWSGDRCIGLASLALDRDGSVHIGVLVEDAWQRRGAGSALVATLVERARHRRLTSIVADVLADDRFILRLLARIGPVTTTLAYGEYRARVELDRSGDGLQKGVQTRQSAVVRSAICPRGRD
jgi:GNAT superfamily N-acetyltransferase